MIPGEVVEILQDPPPQLIVYNGKVSANFQGLYLFSLLFRIHNYPITLVFSLGTTLASEPPKRQSSSSSNSPERSSGIGSCAVASGPATSNVLEVYSAYNSALPLCTCVRLQITPNTSSRQVVDLFVKQLMTAAQLKGLTGPIYSSSEEFCLGN